WHVLRLWCLFRALLVRGDGGGRRLLHRGDCDSPADLAAPGRARARRPGGVPRGYRPATARWGPAEAANDLEAARAHPAAGRGPSGRSGSPAALPGHGAGSLARPVMPPGAAAAAVS